MADNTLPPDGTGGFDIRPVDHDPFAVDPQAEPAALALPPDEPKPAAVPEATPSPLKADLKSWDDYGAVGGAMQAFELAKHAPEWLNTEVHLPTREQEQNFEQAIGHGIQHIATIPSRLAAKFDYLTTPVEPETPGYVSDYDISREQAREKEEKQFGASTALQMVLGGPGSSAHAAEAATEGVTGLLPKAYRAARDVLRRDNPEPAAGPPLPASPSAVPLDEIVVGPNDTGGLVFGSGVTDERTAAARAAVVAAGRKVKPKDVFPPDRPVPEKPNTNALWAWSETPPDHPDMADARYPTGNKQEDDTGPYLVDTAALKRTPKTYENNVNLTRDYPGVNIPKGASTDQVAESFIEHAKNNLLWLWDQIPEATRARSRQWYDGGNRIVKEWAQKYDLPESTVAAVIATQSPQMPWDMNVSLGQRILDIHRGNGEDFYQNFRGTPRMDAFFNETPALQKYKPIWDDIKDKSLGEIDEDNSAPFGKDEKNARKALWTRVYDDAHSDKSFNLVTPEGYFGPKSDTTVHWNTLGAIENAIDALDSGGDRDLINQTLGNKHKVREFYNNLLAPNSPRGDVTIDTHAVAAAHLRPLGGTSNEVAHSLEMSAPAGQPNAGGSDITGIRGTYPLYADAYRRAAAERGVLPREMQSVTWEALKGLFPSKKSGTIFDNIWRQYGAGARGIDETRQLILKRAGGIEPPWWTEYERTGEPHASLWNPRNAEELPRPELHGEGTASVDGGAGSGDATGTAAQPAQASADPATIPGWGGTVGAGGLRKTPGDAKAALIAQSRATAAEVANGRPRLIGLPDEHVTKAGFFTPGPVGYLHDIAEQYMHDEGLPYNPPKTYAEVDKDRAGRIASAFDEMKHDPSDPAVKASYDAMIQETLAQYNAIKQAGIKFELIPPGMEDPYKATPRLASKDVIDNKHLWVYPTETGFGSDAAAREAIKDNPLLAPTDEYIGNKRLTANDVFRIVHDVFGHIKDGNGFRARGEENAWRSHSAMYSDAARPAMTSETRGQNSWLNYGPHGDFNRTASAADTKYADQKVGLLPKWVIDEGRGDTHDFQPVNHNPFVLGSGQTSESNAPRFFSAVERSVDNAKTNSAPAQQWLGAIKNTPGVKPEEMDWLGLENWLKEQKGNVTKQAVQDFVRSNKVDVQEVMKGGGEPHKFGTPEEQKEATDRYEKSRGVMRNIGVGSPKWQAAVDEFKAAEEAMKDIVPGWGRAEGSHENDTKFSQYTLPGGENYRELMLSLPRKPQPLSLPELEEFDRLRTMDNRRPLEGRQAQKLQGYYSRVNIKGEPAPEYHVPSGHAYGDPDADVNRLAHVRFDDRNVNSPGFSVQNALSGNQSQVFETREEAQDFKDRLPKKLQDSTDIVPDTKTDKTLHMAEIQSDWHQAGRKEGYQKNTDGWTAELLSAPDSGFTHWQIKDASGNPVTKIVGGTKESAIHKAAEGIPDAPFKSTWHELALKRMIRYAAENGYDRLSWDTGATNADRYKLSHKISNVTLRPQEMFFGKPSKYTLEAEDHDGRVVISKTVKNADEVADHIGKEPAEKLFSGENQERLNAGARAKLEGLDLDVGGEGMKGFYDKMLPIAANKLVKKYDTKVERSSLSSGNNGWMSGDEAMQDIGLEGRQRHGITTGIDGRENWWRSATQQQRDAVYAEARAARDRPIHSIKITPELRKAAMSQGFPTFAAGGRVPQRADGGTVDDDPQQLGILGTSLQGPLALTAAMGEHADWDKFAREARPSTNVEDDRNRPKTFKERYNNAIDNATDDITSALFRAHGGRVEPKNINTAPTEAQKAAGNYAKDHIHIHGMPITIENHKGGTRRGVGKDGKPWEVTMPAHYGYIKQTEGADGDHVDAYIGPHQKAPHVYVVDQVEAETKKFDEHKALIGFGSEAQAINTYKKGFSDGKGANRIGTITGMTVAQFRDWLRHGNHGKPFKHVVGRSDRVKEILHRHGLDKSATLP